MGNRVNTVMQPCFFALSGVLPADEAIGHIKAIGREDVRHARPGDRRAQLRSPSTCRWRALQRVEVPAAVTATTRREHTIPDDAPEFVKRVTSLLMAGDGDLLPVSALPVDGVFPTGHGQVREAFDRPGDPDLRPRRLHRLRPLRGGVPARDDPDEGLRPGRAGRRPRRVPVQGVPLEGRVRDGDDDPGRARRLHRMRRVRRHVPGEVEVRGAPQGDQHGTGRRPPRGRAAVVGLLPDAPRDRSRRPAPRLGEGLPGAAAAVRVLRRLRRLRRDARTSSSSPSCSATA